MDLLRLVLARQRVEKLSSLPRLISSSQFISHYRELWVLASGENDILREAAASGELSPLSSKWIPEDRLVCRAIFLRDTEAFLYFSSQVVGAFDFWYAIDSGIPEIEDFAIEWIKHAAESDPGICEILDDIPSSVIISWSPGLRKKMSELVGYLAGKIDRSYLFSLEDGDKIFRIREILNYEPTFSQNMEVDQLIPAYCHHDLMLSKYYYHIIKNPEVATELAIQYIDFDLFDYLLKNGLLSNRKHNIQFVFVQKPLRQAAIDARRILDSPAMLSVIPDSTLRDYRVIAGEVSEGRSDFRLQFGNPGPVTSTNSRLNNGSIAWMLLYDPIWVITAARPGIDAGKYVEDYAFSHGKYFH